NLCRCPSSLLSETAKLRSQQACAYFFHSRDGSAPRSSCPAKLRDQTIPEHPRVRRWKRREWAGTARGYLRRVREEVSWRFDVVSIYHETRGTAHIELFKNAFPVS